MLDELLVGGEIQESSKKNIIRAVSAQDVLQEVSEALHDRERSGAKYHVRPFLPLRLGNGKPEKFSILAGRNGTCMIFFTSL